MKFKNIFVLVAVVLLCMIAMPAIAGDSECANGRCVKNAVTVAANVATLPVRVIADGLNDVDRFFRRCDQSQVLSVVPFVVSGQPSVGYVAPCGGDPSPIASHCTSGDLCNDGRIVQTYQRGYRVLSKREVSMLYRLGKARFCH